MLQCQTLDSKRLKYYIHRHVVESQFSELQLSECKSIIIMLKLPE